MFVCEECINQFDTKPFSVFRSRGPCEMCGHVRSCYDLPHGSYHKKRGVFPVGSKKVIFPQSHNMDVELEKLRHSCVTIPADDTRIKIKGKRNAIEIEGKENLIIVEGDGHIIHDKSKNSITTNNEIKGKPRAIVGTMIDRYRAYTTGIFVCDGINDHVQINAAFEWARVCGGEVLVLHRTYRISEPIDCSDFTKVNIAKGVLYIFNPVEGVMVDVGKVWKCQVGVGKEWRYLKTGDRSEALVKIDVKGCKGLAVSVEIPKKYCTGPAMDFTKLEDDFYTGLIWNGDEDTKNNIFGPVVASEDNTMRITIRQKPE